MFLKPKEQKYFLETIITQGQRNIEFISNHRHANNTIFNMFTHLRNVDIVLNSYTNRSRNSLMRNVNNFRKHLQKI